MDHEAIVVGGGHNGLICAAYLAIAGVDTLLVEARPSVGGCASTVEALGARVNVCNCDHGLTRTTPVIDELGLEAEGLRYLDVDPAQLSLSHDGGPAWPIFRDAGRTLEGLRRTYPRQVEGYRRYLTAARPVAELLVELAVRPPTPGNVLRRLADRRARGVATLLRWSRSNVVDVLRAYFDEEAVIVPAYVVGPAVWGLAPSARGTGLGALSLAMKHVAPVGRPVGGSGAFTDAVLARFLRAGGSLRSATRVEAICCEGERVRGIELSDGSVVESPTVVSACDPAQTFTRWLRDPPPGARRLVARWRDRPQADGYESKVDAVVAALPAYRRLSADLPERLGFDPLHASTIISPGLAELEEAHRMMGRGRVARRPMLFANVPSVLDPSMQVPGPDGGHVFSLEVLFTPYRLAGGWAASDEPQRWLTTYAELVEPGFLDGVRRYRVMTPERYESEFNLPRGYATSFAGGPLAALRGKDRERTRYETPVGGLYLTGAGTFPGAGVWGASGRNTAHVVLRRLDAGRGHRL